MMLSPMQSKEANLVDGGVDGRGGGAVLAAFGAAVMVRSWWILMDVMTDLLW
jgi:hypothetical protein